MPITALMLAEPPQVQQMPMPETYQEAREALYVSGSTLFEVIKQQPDQTNNAQLTTAEVINGIGEGLALIAQNTSEKQGQPEPGDVQFSLKINGELQLAFGEQAYSPDSAICYATDRLRHAAFWWLARADLTDSSSTNELLSKYQVIKTQWARERDNRRIYLAIQEATTLITGEMFELNGGGQLFTELNIAWRGAEACFEHARLEIRESSR